MNSHLVRHVAVVVAATAAAAALFAIARWGFDLTIETRDPARARVTLGSVIVTSSMSSALGWALLAALERWTTRGRTLWTRIALTFTTLSLLGPLTTPDLTSGGRVLLCLLHLVVGAVTIGILLTVRPTPVGSRPRVPAHPA